MTSKRWKEPQITCMMGGPQPYNFEPVRRERANEELPRTDGGQSQMHGQRRMSGELLSFSNAATSAGASQ